MSRKNVCNVSLSLLNVICPFVWSGFPLPPNLTLRLRLMADWETTSQSSVGCFRGTPALFLCVLRLSARISSYSLLFVAVLRFEALANVLVSDAVPNPRDFSKSSFFLINRHISISPCPYSMKSRGKPYILQSLLFICHVHR